MLQNFLASFLLIAGSMSAAEGPRVLNAPDSPVAITSFTIDFAGDAPVVKVRLRNRTADIIDDAIIELIAFTPDGRIEAVHSFSAAFPITAGGEILLVRRGELLDLTRGQSIVASPALAFYSGHQWEIPRETAVAVARNAVLQQRSVQAHGDSASDRWGVVSKNDVQPDAVMTCDMQCERAQTRGNATCSAGGVKEFTCACDPQGGISTRCSCYAPPK